MAKFSMLAAGLAAAGAIAMGTGLAGPASADSTADSTFIHQLHESGIPYLSSDLAIGRATAVCLLLQQGHTEADAVQWATQTDRANASPLQDANFAALAESVYCPFR